MSLLSYRDATDEAVAILDRMITAMRQFGLNESGTAFNRLAGDLLANAKTMMTDQVVGTKLLGVFDAARDAGASIATFDSVREATIVEAPTYNLGLMFKNYGVVLALVEQAKILATVTFSSQRDAQSMLTHMSSAFEDAKMAIADELDGESYLSLTELAASVIQHLADTERKLPQVVDVSLGESVPSVAVAHLLYGDASRAEEVVAENSVVHPAFMPRDIVALSR